MFERQTKEYRANVAYRTDIDIDKRRILYIQRDIPSWNLHCCHVSENIGRKPIASRRSLASLMRRRLVELFSKAMLGAVFMRRLGR